MGLFYMFPTKEGESDRVQTNSKIAPLLLKTYGPPMIFWGYLIAILGGIFFIYLGAKAPLESILNSSDQINIAIARLVIFTLIGTPSLLLGLFFTDKWILKNNRKITMIYKVFGILVYKKTINLKSIDSFEIKHYLDSPNIAKISENKDLKAFENRGYFQIFATDESGKIHFIDRSSQKNQLKNLVALLSKY